MGKELSSVSHINKTNNAVEKERKLIKTASKDKRLLLMKIYVLEIMHLEFGFRIAADWPKIGQITMLSQFADRMLSSNFFLRFFISRFNFSYWSKFHVSIITSSWVMTILVYKGLIKNPEIGNVPVWVLPNIWTLGQVEDTKFSTNVCNEKLLNATKFQGYKFYLFWIIKGKARGG